MSRIKNIAGEHFDIVTVNVYDIKTKQIIFTGSQTDAAKFIGTSNSNIYFSLRYKSRIKKRFTVRLASQITIN